MKCDRIVTNLEEYADGTLRWWAARRVSRHLARCGSCRKQLDMTLRACAALTTALREEGDAPDLVAAVMSSLPARRPRAALRLSWAWAACALACIAICLGVLWYTTGEHHNMRPSVVTNPAPAPRPPLVVNPPPKQPEPVTAPTAKPNTEKRRPAPAPKHISPQRKRRAPARPPSYLRPDETVAAVPMPSVLTEVTQEAGATPDDCTRVVTTTRLVVDGMTVGRSEQVAYVLPPNQGAEEIERPPLGDTGARPAPAPEI